MGYDEIFERAVEKTLRWEGGYVCDPADPGGETKYGITRRAYPRLDIKNLSKDDAKGVYFSDYWVETGFCGLREGVAELVFDLGVVCGPAAAARFLQQAVNLLGGRLVVDGVCGSRTRAAANGYPHKKALVAAVKYYAAAHFISLGRQKFLAGWLNRLEDVP